METLQIPFKPWEYHTYKTSRMSEATYGTFKVDLTFETLKSYDRSIWKLGDVVKFGNGFKSWSLVNEWQSWFLKEKALAEWMEKNAHRDRRIPKYARNNYAIIIGRYRWIKDKIFGKYIDYGSYIMMLTGYASGRIRKYYGTSPFDTIGHFPYKTMKYNLNRQKLFDGVSTNSTVETFLECLTEKFHGYRRGY